MLGEGLRAGLGYLGIATRPIVYVEREAHAAAVLVARMEEGSLDPAPVWSDVCTFDAAAWAGKVDCIAAGFPCQDISVAGRRAGLDGKRSGLFFEVLRIAADCGARWLFLENVAGIATATASAVDEAEGALEERAAARVVGELADRGWHSEWLTLSASDVGASHGRERWFCLAWRRELADPGHSGHGRGAAGITERDEALDFAASQGSPVADANNGDRPGPEVGSRAPHPEPVAGRADVDDPARHGGSGPHGQGGSGRGVRQAGDGMANASDGQLSLARRGSQERDGPGPAEPILGHASDDLGWRGERRAQAGVGSDDLGWRGLAGADAELADPGEPRLPQPELGILRSTGGA